jgi:hypothetical protein
MAWNCARDEKSKHAYDIFFRLTTYPACNRLVRRFAKRTSKRKLYRKSKEKHKTWERYRNRIMEELVSQIVYFSIGNN